MYALILLAMLGLTSTTKEVTGELMFATEYPKVVMGAVEEGHKIHMIRVVDYNQGRALKKAVGKNVTVRGKEQVLRKSTVEPLHKKVFVDGKLSELSQPEMLMWEIILQITNTRQAIYGMVGLAKPGLLKELRFTEIYFINVKEVEIDDT